MTSTAKVAARASQDREVLREVQRTHDAAAISFMKSAQQHLRASTSIARQLELTQSVGAREACKS